ncbi:hypothetical protein GI258_01780 [Salmonella enterica subsp. houtenae]|nr:hypothetical protein [Salmonella enterica subsp. houtenae]EEM4209739.1 hypothetical protein [Salmonella enterica subsp. houtenae]
MQARVKWVEGLTFLGESSSGHQVLMDGNSGDKAPSPMEMVLMAASPYPVYRVLSRRPDKRSAIGHFNAVIRFFCLPLIAAPTAT